MTVETTRKGSVGVIALTRPEVSNAVDPCMTASITRALDKYDSDSSIRCVLLTGSGQRAFCAGMDLKAFARTGLEGMGTPGGGFAGITRRRLEKPLIAAVNGAAVGGGFEIVLACDLIVAAEHATFSFPEVKRGLFPAAGGLVRLPQRLPASVARELVLTGAQLSAQRAWALGLVNKVVEAEELLNAGLEMADRVASFDPLAVHAITSVTRISLEEGEAAAWKANEYWDPIVFKRDQAQQNAAAFTRNSAAREQSVVLEEGS